MFTNVYVEVTTTFSVSPAFPMSKAKTALEEKIYGKEGVLSPFRRSKRDGRVLMQRKSQDHGQLRFPKML